MSSSLLHYYWRISFCIPGFREDNWSKKHNYSENEQNIQGKYWLSTWALWKWRSLWCCGKNVLLLFTQYNCCCCYFIVLRPLFLSSQIRNCNNCWIFWSLHTNQYQDFLNWILTLLCLARCKKICRWFLIQVASLLRSETLPCYTQEFD